MRLLTTLTCLIAMVAAPAVAATWSPPRTISGPHTQIGPVQLTRSGAGSLEAWWGSYQRVGATYEPGRGHAEHPVGSDGFGPEAGAPADLLDLQAYAGTRLLGIGQSIAANGTRTTPPRLRVFASFGRMGQTLSSEHVIETTSTAYQPRLAVAQDGRAIAAYIVISGHRRIVRAATRAPGGRFSRPSTLLGTGRADVVATAVGARGDMVVAAARDGKLIARVRRAGHHWGSAQALAVADGPTQWQVEAAIDARGRVEVVWRRHRLGRAGVPGRRSIEATYMPVGSFRFSSAQVVEPDGATAPSPLVQLPGGFAVVYAEDAPNTPNPATNAFPRARITSPRFGPALDAARPAGGLRGVRAAWDPRRGLLTTWVVPTAHGDGAGIGWGAFAAPGAGAFAAPEQITPDENVSELAAGFDPRSGRAVAVWAARPEGTGPGIPIARVHTVVRSAERP